MNGRTNDAATWNFDFLDRLSLIRTFRTEDGWAEKEKGLLGLAIV